MKSNTIFLLLLLVIIIIIIIINFIHKMKNNPLQLIGSNYNIIKLYKNPLLIPSKSCGSLIIFSHNYQHVDLLIMISELINSKNKTIICGNNAWWNKMVYNLYKKSYPFFKFLPITNNTINKMTLYLKKGYNVIIFYYQFIKKTGIYHVIQMSNCNIYTARITCNNKHIKSIENETFSHVLLLLKDSINSTYQLEYNKMTKPYNDETSLMYMNRLKNKLYS